MTSSSPVMFFPNFASSLISKDNQLNGITPSYYHACISNQSSPNQTNSSTAQELFLDILDDNYSDNDDGFILLTDNPEDSFPSDTLDPQSLCIPVSPNITDQHNIINNNKNPGYKTSHDKIKPSLYKKAHIANAVQQ